MSTEATGKAPRTKQHRPLTQEDPSPRFCFDGDVYPYGPEAKPPYTGQKILYQDTAGYRSARREIIRTTPGHPCLHDNSLWPDLAEAS